MENFVDYILSNNVIAYTTAFIIFVITVFLVVRRLIGFVITLLLLFFAIASGLAIANMDLFREILRGMVYEKSEERKKDDTFKSQVLQAYDELKEQFEEQKKNLQEFLEAHKAKKAETPPQEPKPEAAQNPPVSPNPSS